MTEALTTQPSAPAAAAAAAGPPPIPVHAIRLQAEGFVFREFVVRLPREIALADLVRPEVWRLIQGSRAISLQKLDRLTILAWDEAWCATAIVAAATRGGVTLSKPQRIELEPRTEVLAGDENYQLRWVSTGYVVERRSDGHQMTDPFATVALAEPALERLYPQPVGRL